MIKKLFFPFALLTLAVLIFVSPNFKQIAAGVSMLLFGMIILEEGFKAFVEGPLQNLLKKATNKLYKSIGLGFLVTALIQSSSLISVITISFISAGFIGLKAGIGIIFGSNIGTTTTAWLVSFLGLKVDVSSFALPMLAFGILFIFQKAKNFKGIGNVLIGLGFFFLGIQFMKQGFDVYSESINLADYSMSGFWGLIVYTLIGILITLILQSSSAAMALILTALAAGQILYENSLALAIGANIGTTITAILGSLSANISGKRLAGAHLVFNVATGILALIFIIPLGSFVNFIASNFNVNADNYIIKLSLFHTIFNLSGIIIMTPFINLLVRFLNWFLPEKEVPIVSVDAPQYLNESVLSFPQTALKALLDESRRLLEGPIFLILTHGLNLHRDDIKGNEKIKDIVSNSKHEINVDVEHLYYNKVKNIYSQIIKYATLAQSKFSLSEKSMEFFTRIKLANRNMVEATKDMAHLRHNVSLYMDSDNEHIKKEYNRLRKKVSKVLREIHYTASGDHPSEHLERLETLKAKVRKSDVLIDGTLDNLIRENHISSSMATSLANDSDLVASITRKLIETAELLYIHSDTFLEEPN